jgi:hypothetical protein
MNFGNMGRILGKLGGGAGEFKRGKGRPGAGRGRTESATSDPLWSDVEFLYPLNDAAEQFANITDVTVNDHTLLNPSNTDVDATTNFTGKTSLWQTSGNSYYIAGYTAAGIATVGSDWCWEGWYRPTSLDAANYGLVSTRSGTNGFALFRLSGGNIYIQAYDGGGTPVVNDDSGSGEVLTQDVWSHIAIEYHTSNHRWQAWVDGTRYCNALASGAHTETTDFHFFKYQTSRAKGYWQQVRMTNAARYGNKASITVPSTTFPEE